MWLESEYRDHQLTGGLAEYRNDTGDKVTVHQLLNHTSGIPNFFSEVSRDKYSIEDFVTEYCRGDFEFEPGADLRYNNSRHVIQKGNLFGRLSLG